MTFFTKYGPAPCDKNCRSEHQTLFPLFGEGLGTRLGRNRDSIRQHSDPSLQRMSHLDFPPKLGSNSIFNLNHCSAAAGWNGWHGPADNYSGQSSLIIIIMPKWISRTQIQCDKFERWLCLGCEGKSPTIEP